MLLDNKVALITGGNSGIGKAAAELFADNGAQVVVLDKSITDRTEASSSNAITYFQADVRDQQAIKKIVDSVIDRFGKIDVLFSNAGINPHIGKIEDTQNEQWDEIIQTNLRSCFTLIREVIPCMKETKSGAIIGTSSISGRVWAADHSVPYGVAKTGIEAIIKSVAAQYGPDGIRSNCILPGFIETPLNWVTDEQVKANIMRRIPLRRAGTPLDVAKVALFLASDLSSYVNGESIIVDGGFTL